MIGYTVKSVKGDDLVDIQDSVEEVARDVLGAAQTLEALSCSTIEIEHAQVALLGDVMYMWAAALGDVGEKLTDFVVPDSKEKSVS